MLVLKAMVVQTWYHFLAYVTVFSLLFRQCDIAGYPALWFSNALLSDNAKSQIGKAVQEILGMYVIKN
jgi:pyrroloquinoline quinone (PQQ) biosynthesis protein C